jgi:hypothetical protein
VADRLENTPHAGVLISQNDPRGDGVTDQEPQARAETLAAQARSEAGASLGLVLFTMEPGDERPLVYVSLSDGEQVVTRSYQFGGGSKLTRRWIGIRALDLVRRYLIGALDEEID